MISRDEILMGREVDYPLTPELEANLAALLVAVNKLRALYGKIMIVNSGYRPGIWNIKAHGATHSAHESCQAVDIADKDNAIKNWITTEILEECGLYMESAGWTVSWCHCQIRPTHERIFIPY